MNTNKRRLLLNSIKKQIIGNRSKKRNNRAKDLLSSLGVLSKANSVKSLGSEKPQKLLRSILNIF